MNTNFVVDSVRSAFAKLMSLYGFIVVDFDDSAVRLDSNSVSLHVVYDWRNSYEVEIGVCELRNGTRTPTIPFNLGEVFRECKLPDAERASFLQSSNKFDVVAFLNTTAERLEKHCHLCLVGDSGFFTALAKRRGAEAIEYTHKVQLASVRERADEAWRTKRYVEFVKLLEDFSSWLPDADRKKLDYAIKQCN